MYSNIYHTIGWTLIHSVWQIGLISGTLFFLLKSHWLRTPNQRYVSVILSLVAVLMASALTFWWIQSGFSADDPSNPLSNEFLSVPHSVIPASEMPDWKNTLNLTTFYLTLAWMAGFMVYAIRSLIGLGYMGFILKSSIPVKDPALLAAFSGIKNRITHRRIRLLLSEKVISPLTFGIYRATIVIPLALVSQLSVQQIEIILAHEMAHIVRNDFLVNLLVRLISGIFYYHPGIWWMTRILDLEREKATDQLACVFAETDSINYARTLLKTQECQQVGKTRAPGWQESTLSLSFWRPGKQLLLRVESLLGRQMREDHWSSRVSAFVLFIGVFFLLGFTQIILPRNPDPSNPGIGSAVEREESVFVLQTTIDEYPSADSSTIRVILVDKQAPDAGKDFRQNSVQPVQGKDTLNRLEKTIEIKVETDSFYLVKKMEIQKREVLIGTELELAESKRWIRVFDIRSEAVHELLAKERMRADSLIRHFDEQFFTSFSLPDSSEMRILFGENPIWQNLPEFERDDPFPFRHNDGNPWPEERREAQIQIPKPFEFDPLPEIEKRIIVVPLIRPAH
jgi:beta-lactamase regulating signal transducer with metallopeptidase domain